MNDKFFCPAIADRVENMQGRFLCGRYYMDDEPVLICLIRDKLPLETGTCVCYNSLTGGERTFEKYNFSYRRKFGLPLLGGRLPSRSQRKKAGLKGNCIRSRRRCCPAAWNYTGKIYSSKELWHQNRRNYFVSPEKMSESGTGTAQL